MMMYRKTLLVKDRSYPEQWVGHSCKVKARKGNPVNFTQAMHIQCCVATVLEKAHIAAHWVA